MNTNRLAPWLLTIVISGIFCAFSAFASLDSSVKYEKLQDIELSPAQTPRLAAGVYSLERSEKVHKEQLPLQLEGALQKVKARKYHPRKRKVKTISF